MSPVTQEWVVDKAEEDFHVAQREYRARKHPSYNAACFHAQQCAEKYLKARLQEAGIPFSKTHSLPLLLNLALGAEPLWAAMAPQLNRLNTYAVAVRYPGTSATKSDAKQAVADCRLARKEVRTSLGLPT
ncbi:MAG: DNA-binding protein [Verrucomicrobia bacterium]|nr:MAG: DNA-binding protein [Verrucomicrobiota bacterium]